MLILKLLQCFFNANYICSYRNSFQILKNIHKTHKYLCTSSTRTTHQSSKEIENKQYRFFEAAEFSLNKKNDGFTYKSICKKCFLSSTLCICNQVKSIFSDLPQNKLPKASVDIYMHYKEWGRASNTGKLLPIGLPDNSATYIYGRKNDQDELIKKLTSNPSIILYPGENSQSICNYQELYDTSDNIHICVIDSTWSQSYAMINSLPKSIPRVHINAFVTSPSQFLNRRQVINDNNQTSVSNKVSTIEALALGLKSLHENEDLIKSIYQSLQLSVDAVLRQGGKEVAYGNNFITQITNTSSEVIHGPYTARTVQRPEYCLKCNASSSNTIFKNMGLRKGTKNKQKKVMDDIIIENNNNTSLKINNIINNNNNNNNALLHRVWKCSSCLAYFEVNAL